MTGMAFYWQQCVFCDEKREVGRKEEGRVCVWC